MTVYYFVLLRRTVDGLLAFLLLNVFGGVRSLTSAWRAFCDLPELSKIGAITVLVILASVLFEAGRGVFVRMVARIFRRK